MLQAVIRKGNVIAENVPTPIVSDGTILIKVINSCRKNYKKQQRKHKQCNEYKSFFRNFHN